MPTGGNAGSCGPPWPAGEGVMNLDTTIGVVRP
jgi:hypothetical protein